MSLSEIAFLLRMIRNSENIIVCKLISNSMSSNKRKHTISIIMPVYNGLGYIEKSLPPLLQMLERGEVEDIVIVDDSSTDKTVEYVQSLGLKIIPSGGRLGPGAARNMAARIVNTDVIWFIDADVIVHDDAVKYILEAFDEDGVVAIFGSYDENPPAQNFLSQYKNLVHHFYHHRGRKEASTFWSGCGAIKRNEFLQQDGFDIETYKRPSIEDIELGYRLINAGGKILLIPEMLSTHMKEWRIVNLLHTEIFCRAIPWSRLILNSTGIVNDLNVGAAERVRAVIGCFFFIVIFLSVVRILPWWIIIAYLVFAILTNFELFRLFYSRKGLIFSIAAMLYHQFYYLYSTSAFAWCWAEKKLKAIF